MPTATPAPFRIETARLTLWALGPEHAAQVHSVVPANKAHLLPWLPWVRAEPLSWDMRLESLQALRRNFNDGADLIYGLFDRSTGDYVGGAGLHGSPTAATKEVGYWIAAAREGAGLVTEAVAALVAVAFDVMCVTRLEIRCSLDHVRSRNVAERAGFRFDGILESAGFSGAGELEPKQVWALDVREYANHPLSLAPKPQLFDALGRQVCVAGW
jgi:RimJ/RimL family protein N-acetyltransferase